MSEPEGTRRMLDPFDTMRANRLLASHDPKLNDIRWLVGESLRRTHHRANSGHGAAATFTARDKLVAAEERVGPHAWPILVKVIIEGEGVRDCRSLVPEAQTPWRVDAIITDRLRCALDMIGGLMGVTRRQ